MCSPGSRLWGYFGVTLFLILSVLVANAYYMPPIVHTFRIYTLDGSECLAIARTDSGEFVPIQMPKATCTTANSAFTQEGPNTRHVVRYQVQPDEYLCMTDSVGLPAGSLGTPAFRPCTGHASQTWSYTDSKRYVSTSSGLVVSTRPVATAPGAPVLKYKRAKMVTHADNCPHQAWHVVPVESTTVA